MFFHGSQTTARGPQVGIFPASLVESRPSTTKA